MTTGGAVPAAAAQLINIVRTETSASFYLTQLPAQLMAGIDIGISIEPLPAGFVDLYLLPAALFAAGTYDITAHARPVIAYGPAELLPLAFDCGCRDYLREPWSIAELKVRALRLLPPRRMCFSWGTVELRRNTLRCTERHSSQPGCGPRTAPSAVELSPPEAALLKQLLAYGDNPVPRECLQYALHPDSRPAQQQTSRAVDMHISGLRKKLNHLAGYRLTTSPIRSIYGYGYQLTHK